MHHPATRSCCGSRRRWCFPDASWLPIGGDGCPLGDTPMNLWNIMENPMRIMENPMKIMENPMKRMKIVHSLFGKYPCVKLFMALGRIITLLFRQTVREILHFFTSDMHHLTGSQPRAISSTWIWKNNCSRIVIFRRCSFELILWSLLSSLRLAAAMQGRLEVHRLSYKPQMAIVFVLSLSLSFTVALLRV